MPTTMSPIPRQESGSECTGRGRAAHTNSRTFTPVCQRRPTRHPRPAVGSMARGQDAMSWPLAAPGNDLLAAARCRHRRAWPGRKLADDGSGTMEGAGAFREERKIPEVAWNERQPGYEGHREDIRADRRAVLPRDKPVRGRRRALPHL